MRFLITSIVLLFSLSSLADTTLRLESDLESGEVYSLEVTMRPSNPANPMSGYVYAQKAAFGECEGVYNLDMRAGKLVINFDGLNGPGTVGGCNNESLMAMITMENYSRLNRGEEIEVSYMSAMFFGVTRMGRVKIIARS